MKRNGSRKKGFTITEVLISILLFVSIWLASAAALTTVKSLASYSKHKVQAIYVAQRILEDQRKWPFAALANQTSAPISIDSRGTYNTTADDFLGNQAITVTSLDVNRKRVQVEVNWQEKLGELLATNAMRVYCTTDIANEDKLN